VSGRSTDATRMPITWPTGPERTVTIGYTGEEFAHWWRSPSASRRQQDIASGALVAEERMAALGLALTIARIVTPPRDLRLFGGRVAANIIVVPAVAVGATRALLMLDPTAR